MWKLVWCLAIACGPGDIKTDLSSPGYTKDECIAEANARLEREPQMMFVCQQSRPLLERSNLEGVLDALKRGELVQPQYEEPESIAIGPRTLSY